MGKEMVGRDKRRQAPREDNSAIMMINPINHFTAAQRRYRVDHPHGDRTVIVSTGE
jgi:hypothetical protein